MILEACTRTRGDCATLSERTGGAQSPDNPQALARVGRAYIRLKDAKRALTTLRRLEDVAPDDLDNIVRVGLLYFDRKNLPEAIKRFERVLTLRPDSNQVRYYLAVTFIEMKDYDRALTEFKRIPVDSQFFLDSQTQLGFLYERGGRIGDAIRVIEAAVTRDPSLLDLKLALGGLYAKDKRTADAIRIVEEVIAKDPKNDKAQYALAIVYDQAKMQEEAVRQMQKVAEIDPRNASALNYVGYTWAEKGIRLDEAEALIRRAVALKPRDGYIRDSLGWVLYQKGDYQRAVKELEMAAHMASNDPVVMEHLGDAYLKVKDEARALKTYEEALRGFPKAENAAKLREKIDQLKRQRKTEKP